MKKVEAQINLLPDEILLNVFLRLGISAIARVALTQRNWNTLLQDKQFWRLLLSRDIPKDLLNKYVSIPTDETIQDIYKREYQLKAIIHRLIFDEPMLRVLAAQDNLWKILYERFFPYLRKPTSSWRKIFYIKVNDIRLVTNKIQVAACGGYPDIMLQLIKKFEKNYFKSKTKPTSKVRLSWFWQMSDPLEQPQLTITQLVNFNADGRSYSPMFHATLLGNMEIIEILIAHGANVNQSNCLSGETPLSIATSVDNIDIVRLLIKNNANVNLISEKSGNTPLIIASFGNLAVVKLLLAHQADVNLANKKSGITPLSIAVETGHINIAKLLIENNADVNQARGYDGATPLYIAAYHGYSNLVKILIESGANVDKPRTDNGATPLYIAAHQKHMSVMTQLCDAGADVDNISDNLFQESLNATILITRIQATIIKRQKRIIEHYKNSQEFSSDEDNSDESNSQKICHKF